MKTIRVSLGDQSYDIQIGSGILNKTGSILRKFNVSKRGIVISSSRILAVHGEKLINSLHKANLSVEIVTIADGERAKSLSTVETLYKQLAAFRADRKTALIAFGGGVVGDIVGFTAATFLRGIPYVQVPTTLLAQVDSSIGGKTGVNLNEGKNLVGAFHQPRAVVIDPLVLLTLPRREFNSGVYEAIKYGVIQNPALFHLVDQKHTRFPERERNSLEEMITECVRIKADIISRDERESELRMILNFGHTIGHALESATGYSKLTHGEAIGHGMIMATQLAAKLNKIEASEGLQIQEAIARISPLPSIHSLKGGQIFRRMLSDKKVVEQRLQFVLPLRIGQAEIHRDTPGEVVKETIRAYLHSQQKD